MNFLLTIHVSRLTITTYTFLPSIPSPCCLPGTHQRSLPDIYERDFHLPAGHATSFAGGPLAIFRSKDPELTHYETAVTGLFITGAATFPGAGIWGASGRNCAAVVLDRLGIG